MRQRIRRSVGLSLATAMIAGTLAGNALAHELKNPKSIAVTIKDNVIVNKDVSGTWDRQYLKADLTVDYDCGDGWGVVKYDLAVDNFSPLSTPAPSGSPRRVQNVLFKNANIATVQKLTAACGAQGHGVLSVPVALRAWCEDTDYATNSTRDLAKDKSTRITLPVAVMCLETKKSTTVPIRFRHTCPPGYFIDGTRLSVMEDGSSGQKICIPEGLSGMKACPFIFTQNTSGGEWLAQGTILTYHSGKDTERTQAQELTAFSGSVLIREIDPETSYIDSLSVVLFYPDGRKAVLAPVLEKLQAIDSDYLVTNQGDEVEVVFEAPADWAFERAEIIAHGYYEPY